MRNLIRKWLGLEPIRMQAVRRDWVSREILELSIEIGAMKAVLSELGAPKAQIDAALKRHQEIARGASAYVPHDL